MSHRFTACPLWPVEAQGTAITVSPEELSVAAAMAVGSYRSLAVAVCGGGSSCEELPVQVSVLYINRLLLGIQFEILY